MPGRKWPLNDLGRTLRVLRRRWRVVVLAVALQLATGSLVAAGFLVWLVALSMRRLLAPPRSAIFHTPADVGIADYRTVQFVTADGVTLHGWYVPSRNGAAVLLAHGYGDNRVDMLPELRALAAHGYGVLGFDLRGHGLSDEALVTLGEHEQRDICAALDFLQAQPDVDRIGAVGFSMGGAALACVAAHDRRVRALVLESTYPALRDLVDSLTRPTGRLGRAMALWSVRRCGVNVHGMRPVDALPQISPRPLLLIYGDQDVIVPPPLQDVMIRAAGDAAEVWRILPARHQNFAEVVPEAYTARLTSFFDRGLVDTGWQTGSISRA